MKKQQGFVGLVLVGSLALGAVAYTVSSYFHYANLGAETENTLITKQDDNKNVMASYSTKIKEIAQAAKLGVDAQTNLIKIANEARYGEGSSKAVMQWIQEQNPNIDTTLYQKLQQVIDAERTRFANEQTTMLDIRRTYKVMLDKPYSGFWLNVAGYPKINFKDFDVVINDYTETAYQTKKAESIDLSN